MDILLALFLVFIAGILNGSFAFPIKSMPRWNEENIWLIFSIGNYILVPWIILLLLAPHFIAVFPKTPTHVLWVMVFGGLFFGIGMICFALGLGLLGIGLSYVINIGIGTAGGALLPLIIIYPQKIFTTFGLFEIIGIILFLFGVILASRAGILRDQSLKHTKEQTQIKPGKVLLGIMLVILAGLSAAGQGFTYAYCIPSMQKIALNMGMNKLAAANIPWAGIFLAAFIPYTLYFVWKCIKNKSFSKFFVANTKKYWWYAFLMSLFASGCLFLYSKAAQILGSLGPVIAWPMFMSFVVLTSNILGIIQKEWQHANQKTKYLLGFGILLLIFAIIALSMGAYINLSHTSTYFHHLHHH